MKELLDQAGEGQVELFVSAINLGEVYYSIARSRGDAIAGQTLHDVRQLLLTIVSATDDRIIAAARFKARHRISYADAFAVAAANELGATLVTGDPELLQLSGEVQMESLSRAKRK